jgi:putative phosphoribosyl transferase
MIFKDRYDVARRLIPLLEKYRKEPGVMLAVPRGGVPIGYHIAINYNLPLELLMTKKIGHPLNREVAIGAVSLEDHFVEEGHDAGELYIESEIRQIRESLVERYKSFMGDRKPIDIENKTVIITDDGIATGNTILAALRVIRKKHPKRIVLAVPVAPRDTAEKIRKEVDDFICLHVADDFYGVGQYYDDFSEVSDDEVRRLLSEANRFEAGA